MGKIEIENPISFIGKDGRSYPTSEALNQAGIAWKQRNLFYIVYDAQLGRREIAPGTGEVQVCVGYSIEYDKNGMKREVPVYRTERF